MNWLRAARCRSHWTCETRGTQTSEAAMRLTYGVGTIPAPLVMVLFAM